MCRKRRSKGMNQDEEIKIKARVTLSRHCLLADSCVHRLLVFRGRANHSISPRRRSGTAGALQHLPRQHHRGDHRRGRRSGPHLRETTDTAATPAQDLHVLPPRQDAREGNTWKSTSSATTRCPWTAPRVDLRGHAGDAAARKSSRRSTSPDLPDFPWLETGSSFSNPLKNSLGRETPTR